MSDKREFSMVILVCVIVAVSWFVYYISYEKLYTIGTVESKKTGLKSGTVANFTYFYGGEKHEGGTGIGDYKIEIGDKYIVEFAKDKVDLSRALFYYPVPDSLTTDIPWEGWREVPEELKKYRKKRMEIFGLYDKIFKD